MKRNGGITHIESHRGGQNGGEKDSGKKGWMRVWGGRFRKK